MATTPDQIKTDYPLPVYNYKVNIADETVAFSEVSGLSIEYETITFKESPLTGLGPRILYMPGQPSPVNISMKKGYVVAKNINILYAWLNSTALNQIEKKDISISLCDETGAPVVTWKVIDAFPTKLEAPSFSADSNEVAIESLDLMADSIQMSEP